MNQTITKRRFDNLDLLKAIAMLMVVSLHIPVWEADFIMGNYLTALPQYGLRLAMEGVPIFVMVNGFLLFNKRELVLGAHLKRTGKLALLLVIWSLLMIIGGLLVTGQGISLETILVYFFQTQVNSDLTGVLWFLQSLIALYLIMPILKRVYDSDYQCFKYLFYVVSFFTVGMHALHMLVELLQSVSSSVVWSMIPAYLERFNFLYNGQFIFFAMLGGVVLKEKEQIAKKCVAFVVAGLIAWILAILSGVLLSKHYQSMYNPAFNYGSIYMAVMMLGWYAATLGYQNNGKWYHKVISSIGENTLGIYFLHIFVIHIVDEVIPNDSFAIRLVQWLLVYVISWIGSVIMKKIPGVRELVQ